MLNIKIVFVNSFLIFYFIFLRQSCTTTKMFIKKQGYGYNQALKNHTGSKRGGIL